MKVRELGALLRRPSVTASSDARRLRRCWTIDDLGREAARYLPKPVSDFIDGGAGSETTMRRNREALDGVELVPRSLRDVGDIDLTSRVLGGGSSLPIVLGPTGGTRATRSGGELEVARAAAAKGVPYTSATFANTTLEELAAAGPSTRWFQLYVFRDRELTRELILRARAASYTALVVTVDTPVVGKRPRDLRNGFTLPLSIGIGTLLEGARHPAWSMQFLRGPMLTIPNLGARGVRVPVEHDPSSQMTVDPALTWADISWILETWEGPLVVKGLMAVADARDAAAVGASGIVVSNHGGRQLDGAAPTLDALPRIVDAVGEQLEVMFDSGIRSGADIVRALALGAKTVLIGRAYLYGLAAGGEAGVRRAIEILEAELRETMALLGVASLAELDRSLLNSRRVPAWRAS